MHIIDLNGNKIGITDLQLAIMQADDYRHYTISAPEAQEFSAKQKAYWEDAYQKLLLLEKEE
ncbi:MAG: hypothetical protein JWQ66_2139 [Mucilaginibacter sp.]|nr:hypothetical protein [Mucilaginibacter sp.]